MERFDGLCDVQVSGDGFMISTLFQRDSRRLIAEIKEGLVPARQKRVLTRKVYTASTLRETLTEF